MTANSTLGFWRELLQKTIDAAAMQAKGLEISKNYARIQDLAKALQKINPNDIKFLHRYGLFLNRLVNNDFEALQMLEKACTTY